MNGEISSREGDDQAKIDNEFAQVTNTLPNSQKYWRKFGGYLLFCAIRDFFLGETPSHKNTNSFSELAETLILSTLPDNPNIEILNLSEKLLKQQRMLEDTIARRKIGTLGNKDYCMLLVVCVCSTNYKWNSIIISSY